MRGQSLSNSKGFAQQIQTISSSRTPSPRSSQAGSPALLVLSWGHHADAQPQNSHGTFPSAPQGSRDGAGPLAGMGGLLQPLSPAGAVGQHPLRRAQVHPSSLHGRVHRQQHPPSRACDGINLPCREKRVGETLTLEMALFPQGVSPKVGSHTVCDTSVLSLLS